MNKPYFGYVRVSTAKQRKGVSLDAQRKAIAAFAKKNGITITRWFEETGPAASMYRPVFSELIDALKSGRAQGLIVYKIDGLARSFPDWAEIGNLAAQGVDFRFAEEDSNSPSRNGRLAWDIHAVVAAEFIRSQIEEALHLLGLESEEIGSPTDAQKGKPNAKIHE